MKIFGISFKLCALLSLLLAQVCFADASAKTDETSVANNSYENAEQKTDWISSSQYQAVFNKMVDNRYYSDFTEGRLKNGFIQYRGSFKPFFKGFKRFYSYIGMTDESYAEKKATLEAKVYEEIYHNYFLDHVGERLHQACWIKLSTR